jgi:biopolymer transport protein ExbB/TolQ
MNAEAGSDSQLRATIDGSLFWGSYALMLGILGTVVGIAIAAQAVEAVGQVHTQLVWGGIRVSLITTMYGLLVFLGAALVWLGLRSWHRRSVLHVA